MDAQDIIQIDEPGPWRPDPAPSAAILIEIDPEIPVHAMPDRCDWLIRGRVASASPVEDVALLFAGTVVARMEYGRSDGHTGNLLPDGTHLAVFHFHLPRPADPVAGACGFTLAARTRDGAMHHEDFAAVVEAGHPIPALVAAGPVRAMSEAGAGRPPVVLYVERAVRDDGGRLLVHGWAVSFAPLLAVQVHAGDARLANPRLNGVRVDVGSMLSVYPNAGTSGFVLSVDAGLAAGIDEIKIQAISRSGSSHEVVRRLERVDSLPILQPEVPAEDPPAPAPILPDERRRIHFHNDFIRLSETGELWLEGWAVCAVGTPRGLGGG